MIDGEIKIVTKDTLLSEVMHLHHNNWRLIQICARTLKDSSNFEVTYSFGDDLCMGHLRVMLEDGEKMTSISHIYAPAFLYENEIHDLFGIEIDLITIDYQGHFYKIAKETPFKK